MKAIFYAACFSLHAWYRVWAANDVIRVPFTFVGGGVMLPSVMEDNVPLSPVHVTAIGHRKSYLGIYGDNSLLLHVTIDAHPGWAILLLVLRKVQEFNQLRNRQCWMFVGTLPEGYIRNAPLPRVPILQSTSSETRPQVHTIPDYYKGTYVVPTYISPRSIVERAAFAFSPAWHDIAINN